MMPYDDFLHENLPDDPEQAFLILEASFDSECKQHLSEAHQEENVSIFYIQYISKVLGAIQELGLESKFANNDVPAIESVNYSTYLYFSKDVERYKTMLKIRSSRRLKQYSVAFDDTAKTKLRHLLIQMKSTVDQLDISDEKKEALLARISALESEIDRNRTRFEVIGALWLETCAKIGEGVEKLEPLRKWVDSIGNLIWQAKLDEPSQPRRLPPPPTPKRIEPPKKSSFGRRPAQNTPPDINDDIPF